MCAICGNMVVLVVLEFIVAFLFLSRRIWYLNSKYKVMKRGLLQRTCYCTGTLLRKVGKNNTLHMVTKAA